jgi:hypothetical protein
MKKLLLATATVLALAGTAHAEEDCNSKTWTNIGHRADCGVMQAYRVLSQNHPHDQTKDKIFYDGNGFIEAIRDEGGNLLIPNMMPSPGNDKMAFVRLATPRGQLPACDSAEATKILAQITNKTLTSVFALKQLGEHNGKRFCSASLAFRGWTNFTIEWMDQAKGKYWMQII